MKRLERSTSVPIAELPSPRITRFRGTIDHWDPAFLEVLSEERDVVVFDNVGVSASSGSLPSTIDAMADRALDFIDALDLEEIDLLGWSMGGFVAQAIALKRPALVRRLIVAGSNPGQVPGAPASPDKVWEIAPKQINEDDDFLCLFFPETPAARAAGLASLRRLDRRLLDSAAVVSAEGWPRQLDAISHWANGEGAAWERLEELTIACARG